MNTKDDTQPQCLAAMTASRIVEYVVKKQGDVMALQCFAEQVIEEAYATQEAELETLTTIRDRAFDGDINDLGNRLESKEPMSLEDQRELWLWLEEKDVIMGDALERADKVEAELKALREIVDTLPKCWRINDKGELTQDATMFPGMKIWTHSISRDWEENTVSSISWQQGEAWIYPSHGGSLRPEWCAASLEAAQTKGSES